MRQAFMSGAFVVLGPVMDEVSTLPNNDMSADALQQITIEAIRECTNHAQSNFSRRN